MAWLVVEGRRKAEASISLRGAGDEHDHVAARAFQETNMGGQSRREIMLILPQPTSYMAPMRDTELYLRLSNS